MLVSVALVLVGLALLAYASDQFVIGAARVAQVFRISPLVIGVVIIGFGTSAPELLVSLLAALDDEPAIAVGNVVGSNLANLTLLLGVGALLTPIAVASGVVRREAPITVAATLGFAWAVQGGLFRLEGLALLVGLAAALTVIIRATSAPGAADDELGPETEELLGEPQSASRETVRTVLGLIGTVVAAQLLLTGALDIADRVGIAAGVVGATLVAVGTSLPELVTVVQSARRNEPDLIVGNLLGSNIFNALGVAGVAAVAAPQALDAPELTTTATGAALLVVLLAWAAMVTGARISRREAGGLIALYLVTVVLLGS